MTLLGEHIGKIRIIDELGRGGMGEVYIGYDEKLKRKVAVKAIRGEKRLDDQAKARFMQEAELLSRLEHPNICRIYDMLETDDCDVLVLELIKGLNLKKTQLSGLDRGKKLRIALEVAEVLSTAHGNRVVHRDLKPENVMLDDRGQVKVLDFGLAYSIVEPTAATMTMTDISPGKSKPPASARQMPGGSAIRTQQGSIMGTPMFMSPEQARGEPATAASDMYSFGLLLQWLMTEKLPYPDRLRPEELLQKVTQGDALHVEGVEPELAQLIDRLKMLEPAKRPTALDTLERLKWIQGAPKRKAKRRVKLAVIGTIICLLALGATFSTIGFVTAKRAETQAKQEAETAKETVVLLKSFLSSVDPGEKGKDLKVIELLDAFWPRLEGIKKPEIRAGLYDAYRATYRGLGDYDNAHQMAKMAFDIREQVLGPDHPATLTSLSNVAVALADQGKIAESESLHRQCFERSKEVLRADHEETLRYLNNLASAIHLQGKYAEAEQLHRQCLQAKRRQLGPDHDGTLQSLRNLATALCHQEKYAEAELLYRQCVDAQRRQHGVEHPATLRSMGNLASALFLQDKREEAEDLFRRCLQAQRRVLGPHHPMTLQSMGNLAHALCLLEKHEEAEQLHRECVALHEEVLGREHPNTLVFMGNLANNLGELGRFSEAETMFRDCLEVQIQVLGESHPQTTKTMHGLAMTLENFGNEKEARAWYRKAADAGLEESQQALIRLNGGDRSSVDQLD